MEVLTPFVYWAQTESKINLKVDLINVKDIDVYFGDKKLNFSAYGQGARGLNNYEFILDFHSAIIPDESDYKIIDRYINFILTKKSDSWWPRLTCQPQKPPWLKIDFDKWRSEETDDIQEAVRDVCQDYPDMYDHLHKEEFGYRKDSIRHTYEVVGNPMKFIQILQILEIMHLVFDYTRGNPLITTLQVGGRAFILFFMIEAEPRMQTKPVVFYIFLVWSVVEVIRYPYYMTNLLNVKISALTWLRYTIWMPLYPLGFVFEGIIVLRNIPYFEETEKFTIDLPNSWNFAFYFPTFLRIYLLMLCFPGMFAMMTHMNSARYKKLGKIKIKK
ncbi:very-long-chain (3R)-3-hydroxyacyl-CoA dehydratase isoform X2 [Nasonia vitripennis]|uniref:Very-long-chain (3R)-3-hydroxyacyl-CoA dehydratase n=1 Tax=Nasonia vitripennis TaxID=7425 RepID=A0A7M7R3S5_NASVI|nr:very-long-chain (3R)-3-hydroxyacyl-CoA dehydratase isoform X2 [Nasonia vitripennis]